MVRRRVDFSVTRGEALLTAGALWLSGTAFWLGAGLLVAGPAAAGQLSLELIFDEEKQAKLPEQLAWRPDGAELGFLWDEGEGEEQSDLWAIDATSGKRRRIASARQLSPIQPGDAEVDFPVDEWAWAPDAESLLLVSSGDLYLHDLEKHRSRRLTQSEAEEENPKFSPEGARVAFVRGEDLYLVDLAKGEERRLTADGKEGETLNGKTDWVYWEELWNRDSTGFWWSPDSTRLAYYRFDDSKVAGYPLVDARPTYPTVRWQKYPKAGQPNPRVRVGVLSLAKGETVWLETGGDPEDYLARVYWAPDGESLAVLRLNRAQTRLDLLRCAAADGQCSELAHQEWSTWVNLADDFRYLADGGFVWGSEESGWRRLYRYDRTGKRVAELTPEGLAVTSLDGVLEDEGWVLFSAFHTDALGPTERHVFRVRLDGSELRQLTHDAGWNEALVSPKTSFWVLTWSSADRPPRQSLMRPDGIGVTFLPSKAPAYDPGALPKWEFLTIPGPQGSRLPARILRPTGDKPGTAVDSGDPAGASASGDMGSRRPALMYHYGGPGSQVVVNHWDSRVRLLWQKWMAERGYIVFSVDNQASLFFGKRGEDLLHRRFGEIELAGQLAGVDYLRSLPEVDPDRIGLWGWSGGGSNTLYSVLNRPGVWRAAVAGAPVTDWHLYDSIWTERYLASPDGNAEGYRLSSPITYADKLRDPLLLVHGTGDDNVHPQNSLQLIESFVRAGVAYDSEFYPNQKHGFRNDSLKRFYARMTAFFDLHLRALRPETAAAR